MGLAGVLAVLAGCGASRLARAPAAPTDLSGLWVRDAAASDDARRIVTAALPKPRRMPARPDADDRYRARGGSAALDFLRDYVVPADHVEISAGSRSTLTIVQGERRRTHEPGTDSPPSVTDRYGSRVVLAGWDGRALVVRSDGGRQFQLVETFRAGPEADTLAYRVELRAPGLRKIEIDALYRRGTTRPAPRGQVDGPPAPQR